MCKKFNFNNSNKWPMHNPESVLKNERHRLVWDSEIQTDYLISARQPEKNSPGITMLKCENFKFDHTKKWYMRNPEPDLENETDKLFWEFETQTNNLITARWSDLVIINKKKGSG